MSSRLELNFLGEWEKAQVFIFILDVVLQFLHNLWVLSICRFLLVEPHCFKREVKRNFSGYFR